MEIVKTEKSKSTIMAICDVIEWVHDPLQMLNGYHGDDVPGTDLDSLVRELRGEILPDYLKFEERFNELLAELEKELPGSKYVSSDGIDDMIIGISVMEQRASFAAGCLWGVRSAGRSMEEIRKLATLMVPTER